MMDLKDLLGKQGEWLRGDGEDSDIVISTRIRLARNLAGFHFSSRASHAEKDEIQNKVRLAVSKADLEQKLDFVSVADLEPIDRQLLVERQLISRELASTLEGPRSVAFDERESVSIMVTEEDHLRLQVMRAGLALEEAWKTIDCVDDKLEQNLDYSFHKQFGYLTACPTNVGTGMRASVMLHLPALGITKQIEKVFKALQKIHLAVRGLYGEGSRASCDLYQISNQITLGKKEANLLLEIKEVINMILTYERQSRQLLLSEKLQAEQDRIARAMALLTSAKMITSEETMELLSTIRLGVHLKLIENISQKAINELFIQSQSAHLQKLRGNELHGEKRNAARAEYLRERFQLLENS